MSDRRRLLGLAVAVVLALATWLVQSSTGSEQPEEPAAHASVATDDSRAGLAVVAEDQLPVEAQQTLERIDAGGPYPYDRDGVVFENREELLPEHPHGYYAEYTVPTPGADDRGARRIVAGKGDEFYYTADHYRSFVEIDRG
ncbi:MAG TPA: ribonuclease domain-containing protein [Marmoricola sp.]|nr:ribonuclease domain-containing protein [Marmoricola sp.]